MIFSLIIETEHHWLVVKFNLSLKRDLLTKIKSFALSSFPSTHRFQRNNTSALALQVNMAQLAGSIFEGHILYERPFNLNLWFSFGVLFSKREHVVLSSFQGIS